MTIIEREIKRPVGVVVKRIVTYTNREYYSNGVQIAKYDGYDNMLYIRTDCIGSDFSRTTKDRALSSAYATEFAEILSSVDFAKVSEYTYA